MPKVFKKRLIAFTTLAVLAGISVFVFQNCSGGMTSFKYNDQASTAPIPNTEEPANNSNNQAGDTSTQLNSAGGNGSTKATCNTDQENYNNQCVQKCVSTDERIDGVCTRKCLSSEERIDKLCVARCGTNSERVGNVCIANCSVTEERIAGSCVARCSESQERIGGSCTEKCSTDQERINGICIAKCPASLPRGVNGQCGSITKGVPAFVTLLGTHNATFCGGNEATLRLVSNNQGIATYREESLTFGCKVYTGVEVKYNVSDGRLISASNESVTNADPYGGVASSIQIMLTTFPDLSSFAAKNLYFVSSVPASSELKCDVNLYQFGGTNYDGKFAMKNVKRVIASKGNGYGTTPTMKLLEAEDFAFHMYSIDWAPTFEYEDNYPTEWAIVSSFNEYMRGSQFLIYHNDGSRLGGSVSLGLGQIFNQFEEDQRRLLIKIFAQWLFERKDLSPKNLSKEQILGFLTTLRDNQYSQPFRITINCASNISVHKIREP